MPIDFSSAVSMFQNLIWKYAIHYQINGVLLAEDLFQEGLIELEKTLGLESCEDLEPKVFASYFKTRLGSRYRKCIRHYTRSNRDWRDTVFAADIEQLLELKMSTPVGDVEQVTVNSAMFDSVHPSPDHDIESKQKVEEANKFIAEVKAGLDDEAIWVFETILDGEVPNQLRGQFQRMPSTTSISVLGMIFGWDRGKTWRVLKRVRKRAAVVIRQQMRSGSSLLWNEANTKNVVRTR